MSRPSSWIRFMAAPGEIGSTDSGLCRRELM
jgi:hypothetical protein